MRKFYLAIAATVLMMVSSVMPSLANRLAYIDQTEHLIRITDLAKSAGQEIQSIKIGREVDPGSLRWSPDGSRLVYSGGGNIYLINLKSDTPHPTRRWKGRYPCFLKSGKVAYVNGQDIFMEEKSKDNLDYGTITQLCSFYGENNKVACPVYGRTQHVEVGNLTNSGRFGIVFPHRRITQIDTTPDSGLLVFAYEEGKRRGVTIYDIPSGRSREILKSSSPVAWRSSVAFYYVSAKELWRYNHLKQTYARVARLKSTTNSIAYTKT